MNILIIGCNGFIGSNAFKYLQTKKYHVFGCDIKSSNAEIFLLSKDLSNLHLLFQKQTFDICINASGSATVSFSIQNEQEDYLLNYKNVAQIIEVIKTYQPQCKFINLSSAAVYGNPVVLPIKESSSTEPISPYGKHKLLSEKLLQEYALKCKLQKLSLRIFSVYGNGLQKQLFWDIYQKSKQNDVIELFGTGNETRDFIHINDLMLAFEKIILHANFDGSALNVACGAELSIKSVATIFVNWLSPKLQINFTGRQNATDPKCWKADIALLQNLGFKPQISMIEGLKNYATWLKELN